MDIESLANLANLIRFIEQRTPPDAPCMHLDALLIDWLAEQREPADLAAGIQSGCESGVLECVAVNSALCVQLLPRPTDAQAPRALMPRLPDAVWSDRPQRLRASELAEALSRDRHLA